MTENLSSAAESISLAPAAWAVPLQSSQCQSSSVFSLKKASLCKDKGIGLNVVERRGEIEVKNTSFKWVILTLTVSSAVSWQTINARFSHYHSFGRRYLSQHKTQIGFQISKITNEFYDENDSKPVLAPGFSLPPGIPDCTDPSLCWSPPPGALQNASSAVLQGFLSSPLGGRALLFPRSPTLPRDSLEERLLSSLRPLFASQHCKSHTQHFSLLTDQWSCHCTPPHDQDYFLLSILLTEGSCTPPVTHSEHPHSKRVCVCFCPKQLLLAVRTSWTGSFSLLLSQFDNSLCPSSGHSWGQTMKWGMSRCAQSTPKKALLFLGRGHLILHHLTRKQNFLNISRQIPYSRNYMGKDLLLYLATD